MIIITEAVITGYVIISNDTVQAFFSVLLYYWVLSSAIHSPTSTYHLHHIFPGINNQSHDRKME